MLFQSYQSQIVPIYGNLTVTMNYSDNATNTTVIKNITTGMFVFTTQNVPKMKNKKSSFKKFFFLNQDFLNQNFFPYKDLGRFF